MGLLNCLLTRFHTLVKRLFMTSAFKLREYLWATALEGFFGSSSHLPLCIRLKITTANKTKVSLFILIVLLAYSQETIPRNTILKEKNKLIHNCKHGIHSLFIQIPTTTRNPPTYFPNMKLMNVSVSNSTKPKQARHTRSRQ